MGLLEKIQNILGCEYISDIRMGEKLKSAKHLVASLDLSPYPTKDLQDVAEYLYEEDYIGRSREEVISFLKKN